jgi:hypothetical protein
MHIDDVVVVVVVVAVEDSIIMFSRTALTRPDCAQMYQEIEKQQHQQQQHDNKQEVVINLIVFPHLPT